jgi:excinuclease ABC subunit C
MADDILSSLRKRVARASTGPGVYRWKNKDGDILYVGKAKNLRNRLRSYVQKDADKGQGPWKQSFLKQIADFDVTVTNTELEALVLETNLIKEIRPKYNVLMKDDKHYVYIEVTVNDPCPRIALERRMLDPKAKYFGPFLSAWETKQTLEMLNEIFNFRACKESIDALNRAKGDADVVYNSGKLRPCLDYQIGRCCGICAGVLSAEEYRSRIDQVMHFFKGDYKPVLEKGWELMKQAATEKKFERAARLRDMLGIIESLQERQLVSDTSGENVDVIGVALLSGKAHAVLMRKRNGRLIGEEQFALMGSAESVADVLDQLLPQYYDAAADIPDTVILGEDIPDLKTFEDFLSTLKGRKVKVIVPERGKKSHLLELAEKNAHEKAKQAEASWEAESRNVEAALDGLRELLSLSGDPKRIEGYDISHTGGTETVGSMVVMIDGKPRNDQYRNFTIHTMARGVIDDYRSLKEVLTRRLRHLTNAFERERAEWEKNGIIIGKARKADGAVLPEGTDYKEWIVARHEEQIVARARLTGPLSATELRDIWTDESFGDGHLLPFLIRTILHSRKKGKVYTLVAPAYEQAYGSLGFRHVLKPPAFIADRVTEEAGCFVYDPIQNKTDSSLSSCPDLLVIDGGKGQLNTVVDVLRNLRLDIPVIGLAKREEEVFVPDRSDPVLFPQDSPAKFLLMRLRDEAHRFANRHRSGRAMKAAVRSQLDSIPGISPETQQALLRQFGSVDAIRRTPDEILRGVLNEMQIEALRAVL